MADFECSFLSTMGHEGKYSNDPEDAGGETYRGISRVYHPNWLGWRLIDGLKRSPNFPKNLEREKALQDLVRDFYKLVFWDMFQGDKIPNQELADEMFDTGVNMSVNRAVKFLQRSLNYLNRNAKLFPDMVDDGVLGPTTLKCLGIYISKDPIDLLLKMMNSLQAQHYMNYMKKSPIQEKYCRGWFKRVTFKVNR